MLPNTPKCAERRPDTAKYGQMRQNTAKCRKIHPNTPKYVHLAISGRIWRYLAVSGDSWPYLAVSSSIWRYLRFVFNRLGTSVARERAKRATRAKLSVECPTSTDHSIFLSALAWQFLPALVFPCAREGSHFTRFPFPC